MNITFTAHIDGKDYSVTAEEVQDIWVRYQQANAHASRLSEYVESLREIKMADPELEKLLDEEFEIARRFDPTTTPVASGRWVNVPVCNLCWAIQNPDRDPIRVRNADPDTCYSCGNTTDSGIFVRRFV